MTTPQPSSESHRTHILGAIIAAAAVVTAAAVTGGFGLISSGTGSSSPIVSANGGNSRNVSCVGGGAVVQGTVNCASITKEPFGQLRATIVLADPGVFHLAFSKDVGLPPENTGWQELHDEGGVDVHTALFKATLANRSEKPVTVRDIHTELVRSDPPPTGSLAYIYAQGDGPVSQFAARITSAAPKSRAELFKLGDGPPGWANDPPDPPFFREHFISLRPGEIYEATITVQTELSEPRMVSFHFVISGSTPERGFTITDHGSYRLSGLVDDRLESPRYDHYYVDGYLAHAASSTCPSLEVKQWFAEPREPILTHCP